MGIMADLILEGIGPSLLASSLGAGSLTTEIKHVTSLALSRKPLLETLVGVFCSISLAFDTWDLLRDKADRVCSSILVHRWKTAALRGAISEVLQELTGLHVIFAIKIIILCVLDLVGLRTAIIIARVGECDLAAVLTMLSRLAHLFRVMDTVWCLRHILRNMLVSVNNTLPVMLLLIKV